MNKFSQSACFSLVLFVFVMGCASKPSSPQKSDETSHTVSAEKCSNLPDGKELKLIARIAQGVSAPESVVYDKTTQAIYISNVAGSPVEKDKNGWITKIKLSEIQNFGPNSQNQLKPFVEKLNAPKGLKIHGHTLWVTDIDEVVQVSLAGNKSVKKTKIENAKFLNDIAINSKTGEVFVSDMATSQIYSFKKGTAPVILHAGSDLEHPNGLWWDADSKTLVIASWGPNLKEDFSTSADGRLLEMSPKSKKVAPWFNDGSLRLGHLDGLEKDKNLGYFVSDWMAGKVFHVKKDGSCTTLLEGFKGAADIGWVPEKRWLLVPRMGEDLVDIYQL